MTTQKNIFVTDRDMERLERLIAANAKSPYAANLEEELGRAITLPPDRIPPEVVTMNSKVRFMDEETGEQSEVTLVYPHEANVEQGKVSILAPVGSALIGLSVGETIEWPVPSGKKRRLRIESVLYQPEAEGRYDL